MHRVSMWSARAHIRAGDAERERVADELTRHCADGRLTPGELEERLDAAFAARTIGELAAVSRDLPAPALTRSPRRPRRFALTLIAILVLLSAALVGSGVLALAAEEPLGALLVLTLLIVGAMVTVVALGSLLLTLAPLIAVAAGAWWLVRRLVEPRDGSALPPWSLRA